MIIKVEISNMSGLGNGIRTRVFEAVTTLCREVEDYRDGLLDSVKENRCELSEIFEEYNLVNESWLHLSAQLKAINEPSQTE